ncbi:peroxiredoxin-like family protein [Lichenihabitans sp. Uapishka_5]|uniref:peroxiredoxin-like family protein n=1 Tax=Lichenihabitans sp. Uapishka_5 TaxID=3037302 RepID=UPI0029E7FA12|nr:peroxiredoxin-like family protein [Lichenihabitans sp. Uapishka_5]MDX7953887.1 peroxiredoxin-like family protein [Lichenihabitans sp. Uapishka_5]
MSLSDDLARTVDTVRSAVPEHVFEAIGRSITDLQATGIADRAVGVDERIAFPVLEHLDGAPFPLADRLAGRPAILVFYRGGWCPYCNVALRAYAAALPEIEAAGATIVAVTPERAEHAVETAQITDGGLGFPIAVDKGNAFARALGLVFAVPESLRPLYREIGIDLAAWNGDETHELPVPATYVVDQGGVVRWAFVEADFTRRADPRDAIAALKRLRLAAA